MGDSKGEVLEKEKGNFSGFCSDFCWGATGFMLGFVGGFKLMGRSERNVFFHVGPFWNRVNLGIPNRSLLEAV